MSGATKVCSSNWILLFRSPDARDDTPELSSMKWPQMKPESREYLVFDKKFEVRKGLKEDRFKLWEELYPLWV